MIVPDSTSDRGRSSDQNISGEGKKNSDENAVSRRPSGNDTIKSQNDLSISPPVPAGTDKKAKLVTNNLKEDNDTDVMSLLNGHIEKLNGICGILKFK